MHIIEQEFADYVCKFMKRMTAFCLKLDEREQQIIDHGGPDLCHNCIFRCTEEWFDFQILFDPLEEDFDLPARFVQVSDGTCRQIEVVGEKLMYFPGFLIDIGHQTERLRVFFLGFQTGKPDTAVWNDPLSFLKRSAVREPCIACCFLPSWRRRVSVEPVNTASYNQCTPGQSRGCCPVIELESRTIRFSQP